MHSNNLGVRIFKPQLVEKARKYYERQYGVLLDDEALERYLLSLANLWITIRRIRSGRKLWADLSPSEEGRPARAQRGGRPS